MEKQLINTCVQEYAHAQKENGLQATIPLSLLEPMVKEKGLLQNLIDYTESHLSQTPLAVRLNLLLNLSTILKMMKARFHSASNLLVQIPTRPLKLAGISQLQD